MLVRREQPQAGAAIERADRPSGISARFHCEWLEGRRLHLSDGPIDLVIGANGDRESLVRSYTRAVDRFSTLLDELVSELPRLRRPIDPDSHLANGSVAHRMIAAAARHAHAFVTPMVAVAGAVADEILDEMTITNELDRVYVNNGGDIALKVADGDPFHVGSAARPTFEAAARGPRIVLTAEDGIGGIATSGLGGRSLTLGIADAVTTLAARAADADAAATLIANAVDVDDDRIERIAASELDPDSDLAERLVTVSRGNLPAAAVSTALDRGCEVASQMVSREIIRSALLQCDGQMRIVGAPDLMIV